MDPLYKIKNARLNGHLPDNICAKIVERFSIAVDGINRIERASGLHFPTAYVEPSAIISPASQFGYGVLFARTIPLFDTNQFGVVIQVSAPLLAYGLKGTIHAILAHEFLHYLELMHRIHRGEILSDEITGNLFEGAYLDQTRILEPAAVFSDRTLINHIKKRFATSFQEPRLEKKVVDLWINAGLPKTVIHLDNNRVNISAELLTKIRLPPDMADALGTMGAKSKKIRTRFKIY
ncbi:MAG: hypothetical protein F4Y82_04740 [Cenarchaeum sp. SB0665_bin_23]|nr:hypothetical protein [Cenarchaeum sp. SB0667_bin_13]MXY61402.1 hypothetical protein [Cenarchaeum sp. SB0665_bin_23]MXZ94218.1 hypothetical protein [Cenarchaeum sp. SB0666_bin_15]MYB47316.1 hypothetical protein [Cenarchaeum sp. SB0662_bin_33]MYC79795.1 hypothetical protein [Cenarchaeum sp. SB0661_bin_35]MYD58120.1 hypothetical protein [Cenarchaeum sp. SB0678_bin_8]MYG33456.1 hypothetical protein [Cenarchaeum sp. SB0677_bin_16]MYJ27753.1 hypothetical protein [Cenarchaeum sp. SB0672_bin_9]